MGEQTIQSVWYKGNEIVRITVRTPTFEEKEAYGIPENVSEFYKELSERAKISVVEIIGNKAKEEYMDLSVKGKRRFFKNYICIFSVKISGTQNNVVNITTDSVILRSGKTVYFNRRSQFWDKIHGTLLYGYALKDFLKKLIPKEKRKELRYSYIRQYRMYLSETSVVLFEGETKKDYIEKVIDFL